ncbi:type VII toxin-antitoxin system MntA family adenylyltransferase antitoxin [Thermodesulfovibrio hydrogeniphilus]
MLTIEGIKNTLNSVFQKYSDKVLFAYLFGSVAKKDITPLSDIDIAVYFKEEREKLFELKLSLYADICRSLKTNNIDLVVLNVIENLILLEEIVRHGIVIYDQAPQLREEFEVYTLHRAIDFREQRMAIIGK